jgi:regulator of replication initiation timing
MEQENLFDLTIEGKIITPELIPYEDDPKKLKARLDEMEFHYTTLLQNYEHLQGIINEIKGENRILRYEVLVLGSRKGYNQLTEKEIDKLTNEIVLTVL